MDTLMEARFKFRQLLEEHGLVFLAGVTDGHIKHLFSESILYKSLQDFRENTFYLSFCPLGMGFEGEV